MSRAASSRWARWWMLGANAVHKRWRRTAAKAVPQTADELLDYARHIEPTMPGLAADLRAAALRHLELSATRT